MLIPLRLTAAESKANIEIHKKISRSGRKKLTHPTTRRRGDVVTKSLCTSQQRRRYLSSEAPNDVSVERHQNTSVVLLRDILLEHPDDVSRVCNNDVPSVPLHDVSNKSQMKHPTTSQWYVSITSH